MGFRVWGLGFGVWGLRFRVGFGVWTFLGFYGLGFVRILVLGSRVSGLKVRDFPGPVLTFRVWDLRFKV